MRILSSVSTNKALPKIIAKRRDAAQFYLIKTNGVPVGERTQRSPIMERKSSFWHKPAMDDGLREILFLKSDAGFLVLESWRVYNQPYQETYLRGHYQGIDAEEAAGIANQIFEDVSSEGWLPDTNDPFCRGGGWQKDTLDGCSINWSGPRFNAEAMIAGPDLVAAAFGWAKNMDASDEPRLLENPKAIGRRRRLSSLAR
jgi:hypothetical protein